MPIYSANFLIPVVCLHVQTSFIETISDANFGEHLQFSFPDNSGGLSYIILNVAPNRNPKCLDK